MDFLRIVGPGLSLLWCLSPLPLGASIATFPSLAVVSSTRLLGFGGIGGACFWKKAAVKLRCQNTMERTILHYHLYWCNTMATIYRLSKLPPDNKSYSKAPTLVITVILLTSAVLLLFTWLALLVWRKDFGFLPGSLSRRGSGPVGDVGAEVSDGVSLILDLSETSSSSP